MTKDKNIPKNPKAKSPEVIPPEAVEKLEEVFGDEKAGVIVGVISESRITASGPLPLSSEFAGYEATLPGAAREILDMAKKEQEHRHSLANKDIRWGIGHQYLSLLGGMGLLSACIGGAVYLALHKQPVIAGLIVGVAVLGVITTIVRSRPAFSGMSQRKVEKIDEDKNIST